MSFTHYDADVNPPAQPSRGKGVQASSDNRCPCCDSPQWCFILDSDAVICGRTDVAPDGWEQSGTAKDGRHIYSKTGTQGSSLRYKGVLPNPGSIVLKVSPKTHFPEWVEIGSDPSGIKEVQVEFAYPDPVTGEPLGKVVRKQWEDRRRAYNNGKDTKNLRPWHWAEPYHPNQGDQGWWSDRGKGDKPWGLYRETEVRDAIASGECDIIFNGTGEQSVDSYRRLGLFSVCAQGGEGTGDAQVISFLRKNTPRVFVIAPDEDEAGHKAGAKLQEACSKVRIPVIKINLKNIWSSLPVKGDITDILTKSGMSESEIVKRLEAEIRRAIAEHQEHERQLNDPDERLKLELKAILKEPDLIRRMRLKNEVASHYRLSKVCIEEALRHLEQQATTPRQTWYSFDDFFSEGSNAIHWVVPQVLPRGETVLLAAQAKCGKTNLATDIMYAVLSGGTVLGEQVGVKGKVLLISSDESTSTTRRRMKLRGFDLLPERSNFRVMTHLDITNLSELEARLEDFRPDLVVIDSLTTIAAEVGVSEKDPEFARYIYKLKALLGQYGAACILTHHENKDSLAKGINQVSGSARIPAAVWGILQLKAVDQNNETDPRRYLKIKPREGEAITLSLELNPKDTWVADGIWRCLGEVGDELGQKKTQGDRVLDLLRRYSPKGLTYKEVDANLNIGKSLYQVLDRLEDRQLITKRRSEFNSRQWVYAVPENKGDTPPPSVDHTSIAEITKGVANTTSQQFNNEFNTNSTPIQQPILQNEALNSSNVDAAGVSTPIKQNDVQGGGVVAPDLTEQVAIAPTPTTQTAVDTDVKIGDCVADSWGHVARIEKLARGGWLLENGTHISRDELRANVYVKVAPCSDSSKVPVEPLQPTDEWASEENIEELAQWLSECDSIEMLAEIRSLCPYPSVLSTASKKLNPIKFEQVKQWVIKLNEKPEID